MIKLILTLIMTLLSIIFINGQILEKPKVDERIEIVSIAMRLAEAEEYSRTHFKLYTTKIDDHFKIYQKHELIQFIKSIRNKQGIGYDAPMALAIHLGQAPDFKILKDFDDKIPEPRWGKENAEKFVELLRQFYNDSDAKTFFKNNQSIVGEAIKRYMPIYEKLNLNWYSKFYGQAPKEKFHPIIALGNGSNNYGPSIIYPNGNKEVYAIGSVYRTDDAGMPKFDIEGQFLILLHEFNHSFVNHLLDSNPKPFEKNGEKIFSYVADKMKKQAYPKWSVVLNEALVRAAVVKYMIDNNFSEKEIDDQKDYEISRGFYWINDLVDELVKYDTQRDKYPTLESYMPNLAKAYEKYAENMPAYINKSYEMPNKLTSAEKLYGLSKFWQEVNYNFVYINNIDRNMWENKYKELLGTITKTPNDYEYYRELQKFCALLNDGHTNVNFPEKIENKIFNTMFGNYRLFLEQIENKAIIIRTNPSKKDETPVGSEIIEVNGICTQDYINQFVKPFISSSADYIRDKNCVSNLLISPIGTAYQLKIKKPNNEINTITVKHEESNNNDVYPPYENRELLDFKWLENQTAYLSLNGFHDKKIIDLFKEKLPELYNAKLLIIDLRNNGGGSTNIGAEILKYLTHDKELLGSKYSSRQHIPSFKAWGTWVSEKDTINNDWNKKSYLYAKDMMTFDFEYHREKNDVEAKKIVIPTAILIGNNTASSAEDFLIYADNQKHMTKIGEKTYASTGQPLVFDLPGGGSARVCTKKDTYPDGRIFVGVGIKPDIEIKPTLQDYMENKDVVLEKAIAYLSKK